jgi:hypothetical protein
LIHICPEDICKKKVQIDRTNISGVMALVPPLLSDSSLCASHAFQFLENSGNTSSQTIERKALKKKKINSVTLVGFKSFRCFAAKNLLIDKILKVQIRRQETENIMSRAAPLTALKKMLQKCEKVMAALGAGQQWC